MGGGWDGWDDKEMRMGGWMGGIDEDGGKGGWGWDEKDGKKVWKKYIVIIIDKINKNCTKNI